MSAELFYLLRHYIALPTKIHRLKEELDNYSDYYYSSRSFTGSSLYNPYCDIGQPSRGPEWAVIEKLSNEEAIRKRIKRLEIRYELFSHVFSPYEKRKMRSNIAKRKITFLELRACKVIAEFVGLMKDQKMLGYLMNEEGSFKRYKEESIDIFSIYQSKYQNKPVQEEQTSFNAVSRNGFLQDYVIEKKSNNKLKERLDLLEKIENNYRSYDYKTFKRSVEREGYSLDDIVISLDEIEKELEDLLEVAE